MPMLECVKCRTLTIDTCDGYPDYGKCSVSLCSACHNSGNGLCPSCDDKLDADPDNDDEDGDELTDDELDDDEDDEDADGFGYHDVDDEDDDA